jgi:hypothetical protein
VPSGAAGTVGTQSSQSGTRGRSAVYLPPAPSPSPTASPSATPSPVPGGLVATPASLVFTAAEVAAVKSQTVTISGLPDHGEVQLTATISGTGNCPTVTAKDDNKDSGGDRHDEADGSRRDGHGSGNDKHGQDGSANVFTVTPAGPGPATCTLTILTSGANAQGVTVSITVDGPTASPSPTKERH